MQNWGYVELYLQSWTYFYSDLISLASMHMHYAVYSTADNATEGPRPSIDLGISCPPDNINCILALNKA